MLFLTFLLPFLPIIFCHRSKALVALEDGINDLRECAEDVVVSLLSESFRLKKPGLFKAVMTLCPNELPFGNDRYKQIYYKAWCSQQADVSDHIIEAFLEEERCDNGYMFKELIDRMGEKSISPRFKPFLTIPRIRMLQKYCHTDKAQVERFVGLGMPGRPKSIKSRLGSWLSHLRGLEPDWPFENLLEEPPKDKIYMATVSGAFSNHCNAFVRSTLPEKILHVEDQSLVHEGNIAGIVTGEDVREIASKMLKIPQSAKLRRVMKGLNFGRYRLRKTKLSILTQGEIGVWLVRLSTTNGFIELETICDSIWSNQKCKSIKAHLPRSSKEALVIFMGSKSVISTIPQPNIKGVLQNSDVSTFNSNVRQLFKTLRCSQDLSRPTMLASYIFKH
jgi:hypothetical protein